nr:lysosomal pro-x carboxypeptidase [Quercus suber]
MTRADGAKRAPFPNRQLSYTNFVIDIDSIIINLEAVNMPDGQEGFSYAKPSFRVVSPRDHCSRCLLPEGNALPGSTVGRNPIPSDFASALVSRYHSVLSKMIAALLYALIPFASAFPWNSFHRRGTNNSNDTFNQTASDESACSHPTESFTQPLDHFDSAGNQTFQQRYQIIDQFFKPGGPILFYQGAETAAFACIEKTSLYEFAEETGALALSLEHRFFGNSAPFSLNFSDNAEWPTKDLASLTLDNVLLDSVRFVEWIQSTIPGVEYSKLERTYLGESAEVSSLIRSGMKTLKERFEIGRLASLNVIGEPKLTADKGDYTDLASELHLCSGPTAEDQYPALAFYLLNSFYSIAQYNYNHPLGSGTAFPLQHYINITSSNSTAPLIALANAAEIANQMTNQQCGEWNLNSRSGGLTIPFAWILCTYFPYTELVFTTSTSIFGTHSPDPSVTNINEGLCQSSFGIPARAAEGIREEYNITRSDIESLTRVIFSEGLDDPVTAMGPSPFYGGQGPLGQTENSKMILISRAGHGEDLFATTPLDSVALIAARRAEIEAIKEWIQ